MSDVDFNSMTTEQIIQHFSKPEEQGSFSVSQNQRARMQEKVRQNGGTANSHTMIAALLGGMQEHAAAQGRSLPRNAGIEGNSVGGFGGKAQGNSTRVGRSLSSMANGSNE
jgi:hypothetical protein